MCNSNYQNTLVNIVILDVDADSCNIIADDFNLVSGVLYSYTKFIYMIYMV